MNYLTLKNKEIRRLRAFYQDLKEMGLDRYPTLVRTTLKQLEYWGVGLEDKEKQFIPTPDLPVQSFKKLKIPDRYPRKFLKRDKNKFKIYNRFKKTCQNCLEQFTRIRDLRIHHVIPLFLGGQDIEANLTLLCKSCHFKKHKEILRLIRDSSIDGKSRSNCHDRNIRAHR
jgi:hypothetical protein